MAAAKRQREASAARPRKRAKRAPSAPGGEAKPSPDGAGAGEHRVPPPVSQVRTDLAARGGAGRAGPGRVSPLCFLPGAVFAQCLASATGPSVRAGFRRRWLQRVRVACSCTSGPLAQPAAGSGAACSIFRVPRAEGADPGAHGGAQVLSEGEKGSYCFNKRSTNRSSIRWAGDFWGNTRGLVCKKLCFLNLRDI